MEWIRVEDLVPEDESKVLCYFEGRRFVGRYEPVKRVRRDGKEEMGMWSDEECTWVRVSHWQPLSPDPE